MSTTIGHHTYVRTTSLKKSCFILKLLPLLIVIVAVSIFYLFRKQPSDKSESTVTRIAAQQDVCSADEAGFCKREISVDETFAKLSNEDDFKLKFKTAGLPGEKSSRMESLIQMDENLIIPGFGGGGVAENNIPGIDRKTVKLMLDTCGINTLFSDRIPYDRNIPDARHPDCKRIVYDEELPTASIVIIFHNEPWSLLLRTVYSVINRTPKKLLHEIILIDDASDKVELQDKLTYYVRTRLSGIVKLVRIHPRAGLIRSKQAGAHAAKGNVLVFMDAHCEVGFTWLEPLLWRISGKRNTVVVPVIDWIDKEHFGYMYDNIDYVFYLSAFDWSGYHTWFDIPEREKKRVGNCSTCPIMSPTMLGGIYAIDRNYFWEMGGYDVAMEIWGSENIEMAFRIWQCGGSLEVHPCSRVGHVFRSFRPYSFNGKDDALLFNTARTIDVWTDDYRRIFYLRNPLLKGVNVGNITDRKHLREKLKCKNFQWYMKNVFPEKFILDEDSTYWGRVRSRAEVLCFDKLHVTEYNPYNLTVFYCQPNLSDTQFFSLSKFGELRRESMCAQVKNLSITMVECTGEFTQRWEYTRNGHIRHLDSDVCITCKNVLAEGNLQLESCTENNLYLQWDWEYTNVNNEPIKNF